MLKRFMEYTCSPVSRYHSNYMQIDENLEVWNEFQRYCTNCNKTLRIYSVYPVV